MQSQQAQLGDLSGSKRNVIPAVQMAHGHQQGIFVAAPAADLTMSGSRLPGGQRAFQSARSVMVSDSNPQAQSGSVRVVHGSSSVMQPPPASAVVKTTRTTTTGGQSTEKLASMSMNRQMDTSAAVRQVQDQQTLVLQQALPPGAVVQSINTAAVPAPVSAAKSRSFDRVGQMYNSTAGVVSSDPVLAAYGSSAAGSVRMGDSVASTVTVHPQQTTLLGEGKQATTATEEVIYEGEPVEMEIHLVIRYIEYPNKVTIVREVTTVEEPDRLVHPGAAYPEEEELRTMTRSITTTQDPEQIIHPNVLGYEDAQETRTTTKHTTVTQEPDYEIIPGIHYEAPQETRTTTRTITRDVAPDEIVQPAVTYGEEQVTTTVTKNTTTTQEADREYIAGVTYTPGEETRTVTREVTTEVEPDQEIIPTIRYNPTTERTTTTRNIVVESQPDQIIQPAWAPGEGSVEEKRTVSKHVTTMQGQDTVYEPQLEFRMDGSGTRVVEAAPQTTQFLSSGSMPAATQFVTSGQAPVTQYVTSGPAPVATQFVSSGPAPATQYVISAPAPVLTQQYATPVVHTNAPAFIAPHGAPTYTGAMMGRASTASAFKSGPSAGVPIGQASYADPYTTTSAPPQRY